MQCACGDNCRSKLDFDTIVRWRSQLPSRHLRQFLGRYLRSTLFAPDHKIFLVGGTSVCKATFQWASDCSHYLLKQAIADALAGVDHVHPSHQVPHHNTVDWDFVDGFINYKIDMCGEFVPSTEQISLYMVDSFRDVYEELVNFSSLQTVSVSLPDYSTFMLHLKKDFKTLHVYRHTDLPRCSYCVSNRKWQHDHSATASRQAMLHAKELLATHLDRIQRESILYYRRIITAATFPNDIIHLTVDGMAKLSLPLFHYVPKNALRLTPIKANVYALIDHASTSHNNLFLSYDHFWSQDANYAITILHSYIHLLLRSGRLSHLPSLWLQGDNKTADNKNRWLFGYLAALVQQRIFRDVTLDFLSPGHNHKDADAHFGVIPQTAVDSRHYSPGYGSRLCLESIPKQEASNLSFPLSPS